MEGEIVVSVVLLFMGIALLVLIHICIVQRIFRSSDYQAGDSVLDSSQTRRQGNLTMNISMEDLNRLPCFDHVIEVGGISGRNNVDCAVCLESFKGGEKCRSLPHCGHYFHAQCVDYWLLKTPICPICRACTNSPGIIS